MCNSDFCALRRFWFGDLWGDLLRLFTSVFSVLAVPVSSTVTYLAVGRGEHPARSFLDFAALDAIPKVRPTNVLTVSNFDLGLVWWDWGKGGAENFLAAGCPLGRKPWRIGEEACLRRRARCIILRGCGWFLLRILWQRSGWNLCGWFSNCWL